MPSFCIIYFHDTKLLVANLAKLLTKASAAVSASRPPTEQIIPSSLSLYSFPKCLLNTSQIIAQ